VGVARVAERVKAGDLEGMLTSQAVTLNAVFTTLTHSARSTKLLDHFDHYLRLALRAQSQCRATLETLAVVKNPPVFAKQANAAGQQVVNNGVMVGGSRAGKEAGEQNGLLEAPNAERVDQRAAYQGRRA
jgi:hypothetical protein